MLSRGSDPLDKRTTDVPVSRAIAQRRFSVSGIFGRPELVDFGDPDGPGHPPFGGVSKAPGAARTSKIDDSRPAKDSRNKITALSDGKLFTCQGDHVDTYFAPEAWAAGRPRGRCIR